MHHLSKFRLRINLLVQLPYLKANFTCFVTFHRICYIRSAVSEKDTLMPKMLDVEKKFTLLGILCQLLTCFHICYAFQGK